jgi:hypothetical protein
MQHDPTECAGVPVELPPRLLDVPLTMRVSGAMADLLCAAPSSRRRNGTI